MKPSVYNHVVEAAIDGQYLAFNALSGAFHVLDEQGLGELDELLGDHSDTPLTSSTSPLQQRLRADGFVVDDALDERSVVIGRYHHGREAVTGVSLTIVPTLNCNFACDYCFQSHSPIRMDSADIEATIGFAEQRLQPGTSLGVTWFGGEPLVAFDVIQKLAPRLAVLAAARGCSFHHSIITNGFLLTAERAAFLASIPTFGYAQVTLDGPPERHDHRRITVGGKGSFERIVSNVAAAVEHIDVSVRVNVDRSNVDSVDVLLDLLRARGLQRLNVYLAHVWDYTAEVGGTSQLLSKQEFAHAEARFQLLKFQIGFSSGATLPVPRSGPMCVADRPNGAVLAPGGLVFSCWNEVHLPASEAIGRYAPDRAPSPAPVRLSVKPEPNRPLLDGYDPFTHLPCETCAVAPLCMAGCPWEAKKALPSDPGFCTPLRFNLPDRLRLYHLETVARQAVDAEALSA